MSRFSSRLLTLWNYAVCGQYQGPVANAVPQSHCSVPAACPGTDTSSYIFRLLKAQ